MPVAAQFDDGAVDTLRRHDLGKLDRGWAISVHKAQGSDFQHVVIPIVESRLLDRALVYTAVTPRAVRSVVLLGDEAQLGAEIENSPNALLRRVALALRRLPMTSPTIQCRSRAASSPR